jgi:SAM-dependent methyltransferase
MNERIPLWAQNIICDPSTKRPLEWMDHEVRSDSGAIYKMLDGIAVFQDFPDSYMNRQTVWPAVDRNNPTIQAFERKETVFDRYADRIRDKIIVDMCSGGGMPSYYLAARYGCRVVSIERSWIAIKHYADHFRDFYGVTDQQVVRICADAAEPPIKDTSVDVVLGSSWIHHFEDKVSVLKNAFHALKPGGLLIAHNEGMTSLLARPTSQEDRYTTAAKYREAMVSSGFANVDVKGCSRWYWMLGWLKGSVDVIGTRP